MSIPMLSHIKKYNEPVVILESKGKKIYTHETRF